MTLEHILVQGFKKKEMDKKHLARLLIKTSRCCKASKFLKNNDLAKSLFWHETNFERFSLESLNIAGAFKTQSNISDEILFRK